ncbi:MAG: hypothetical protein HYZ51_05070 [Candidatus Doudnabacteria bacterium]|nr:hypothetical protein [Candidatus Doudnabacteria bacterium]
MEALNQSRKKEHIHFGHLGAVVFCAVFLIAIAFLKGGYKVFQNQAGDKTQKAKTLTYQGAEAQSEKTLAEENKSVSSSNDLAGKNYQQLSIIDPNFGQGEVLGLNTNEALETLGYPDPKEIFAQGILDSFPVKMVNDGSEQAIENYKFEIDSPEIQNSVVALLASLSQDNSTELETQRDEVLNALLAVEVPSPLVEYHKLNLLYYFFIVEAYKNNLVPDGTQKADNTDAALVVIPQRMSQIKKDIQTKYNIEL